MDGPYDPAADPWEGVSATLIHADIYPCPREWAIPPYVANNDALFYVLRGQGWLECDGTHPLSPKRPDSDRAVLEHTLAGLVECAGRTRR